MRVNEQIGSVEQRLPNEFPGSPYCNRQGSFTCHSGSREAAKENRPPIYRWEPAYLDSKSRQGRQNSTKKLPPALILSRRSEAKATGHFRQVATNQPFVRSPRLRTRENDPIFPVSSRPKMCSLRHSNNPDPSGQVRVNPTKSHLKKNVFFKSALRFRVRIETPRPISRQNLTGQTALVLRLYAPVLRGIRALKMLSRKNIDVYWNLYCDCYSV
jgi:hypothetical protein